MSAPMSLLLRLRLFGAGEVMALAGWTGLAGGAVALCAVIVFAIPRTQVVSVPNLTTPASSIKAVARSASFGTVSPSPEARQVADWIAHSRDNGESEFVMVDKKYAQAYVFDSDARLLGATAVLLGASRGDDSVPGIGSRPIEDIRPEERTTPAGRFVAQRGRNLTNEDVVWVDYGAAVSMHRVRTTNAAERRLERLASPTIEDNRISWGCINVPAAFYEAYIAPVFVEKKAVVYILPDVKSVAHVFGFENLDKIAPVPAFAPSL